MTPLFLRGFLMIFDKLCGLVERHLPEYKQIIEDSNLFIFPGRSHEILTEITTDSQFKRIEVFQLPFTVTAVEDTASLVILIDCEPGQIGFDKPRYFIEAMPFISKTNRDDLEFVDYTIEEDPVKNMNPQLRKKMERSYIITSGYMENMICKGGAEIFGDGRIDNSLVVSKQDGIISDASKLSNWEEMRYESKTLSMATNAITALEEILHFSSPEFFILEAESKEYKKAGVKKIRRSNQRPIYTMLKPTEIRNKLGLKQPESQRGSPRPHERRAHYRRLRKESGYKEDRIVPVKACWIGPTQAEKGGKRYKVRLDLFS